MALYYVNFSSSSLSQLANLCTGGDVLLDALSTDLVPANLSKLLNLLTSASTKWFDLGLQLNIDYTTLTDIRQESRHETRDCFRGILATWLGMTPNPSWEDLLAALKAPSVGHMALAEDLATVTWTEDELKQCELIMTVNAL
jgi:hypothetical protein